MGIHDNAMYHARAKAARDSVTRDPPWRLHRLCSSRQKQSNRRRRRRAVLFLVMSHLMEVDRARVITLRNSSRNVHHFPGGIIVPALCSVSTIINSSAFST